MRILARLIGSLAVCGSVSAEPASVQCEGTHGSLTGASDVERQLICSAASAVEAFLAHCQLPPPEPYRIAVRGDIKGYYGQNLLGRFQPSLRQAEIVPFADSAALIASIEPDAPMSAYRQLAPPDLYRSIAAHEIAHAITHQNLRTPPNLLVHEYISAVVQISLLPAPARETYLAAFKGLSDASDTILNDLVLAMDPARFGVASFHHFQRPGNRCAFLTRIMRDKGALPRTVP